MKKLIIVAVMLTMVFGAGAQGSYSIIPYPNKLVKTGESFEFKSVLTVSLPDVFKLESEVINSIFSDEYGIRILFAPDGQIQFKQNKQLGEEAYRLAVHNDKIEVEASTTTGCFWAFQTIRQLMELTGRGSYIIAGCWIEDQPAYKWRAFMLDEGRYFKGKKVVKDLLDQMALLKLNIFHWHLTDDQGWRIEIKKYPLLTDVGAWRDSTQSGVYPTGWSSEVFDPYPHGGFYSQGEIKEIVAYASKLHITIVPEIEMPGHTTAAIAAYPWLGAETQKIKVPTRFGKEKYAFNVADEKVYGFIEDVLNEIMALFPGKVIHIGGDEVSYDKWKKNDAVNALMKKEGFKTYSDVQVYFTNRISDFIDKKGRRMMGWNEIMGDIDVDDRETFATTSLAKSSIVHFWKGDIKLLNNAIEKGYDVVNSDNPYTYLDYTYKDISLQKAYSFEPVPKGINPAEAKHVLGIGCQMWGEWIPKVTDLYRQVYPRIAAYAEVGWTNTSNKDFNRFGQAIGKLERYWDTRGISYYDKK